jgi:hypothetical protein
MRSNVFISPPTFPEEITNEMIFSNIVQYVTVCCAVVPREERDRTPFPRTTKKRPCTQLYRENRRISQELIENPTNNNCRRRFLEEVLRRRFFHECIQPIATHTQNFNVANE